MIVGVPKEIKQDEYRVALLPVGAEELTRAGHTVLVERGAGLGSGINDEVYSANGAELVNSPAEIYARAELVIKVKEPQPREYSLLRPGQILFTYFHFAADASLTQRVLESGVTAVAYETLRGKQGDLSCLTPMSEVAGRMSIQEGAKYLERPQEGRGILLGGVPGVLPAHITILGGGVVGKNAAQIAAGFQADVSILDINVDRLRYLEDIMPGNVNTLYSDRHNIREELQLADLVIGSVLIPGACAQAGDARRPQADEAGLGHHRRGHRPRRLPGNVTADDPFAADVHRRRHRSLLRDEHAGRRRPHEHVRAVQRHLPLRPPHRRPGFASRLRRRPRPHRSGQHARRQSHQPRGGGDVWAEVSAV